MVNTYEHYSDYTGPWPWTQFSPREVACKHCGELYVDTASLDSLQKLRKAWGKPIFITSGHRCAVHNGRVGGVASSQHLELAFDCAVLAHEQEAFVQAAREAGFTGVGQYPSKGFVHLDMGPARTWRG